MKALKTVVFSIFGTTLFAASIVFLAGSYTAHNEQKEAVSKEVACQAFAYSQYEYWQSNRMLPNEGLVGSQWVRGYDALLSFQRHIKSPDDAFNASFTWCMRR